ncbi:MAG: response regulator [Bdellovibrionota bacterium]
MKTNSASKSVLLIDDDPTFRKALRKLLIQLNFSIIDPKTNGEQAWNTISSHRESKFSLIILDWNIPKINGLTLLNRIRRNDAYSETPVLIISGLLENEDLKLFEEFPLTESLQKPVVLKNLANTIENLLKEEQWYQSSKQEILSTFDKIGIEGPQSLFMLRQLITESPKPNALVISAAKILIHNERFTAAEELLSFFLEATPDSLIGMNQLAKVYLHTKRFGLAKNVLEQAQYLSPKNLDRLCLLGDANLTVLDLQQAQHKFDTALQIDNQNLQAKVGREFSNSIEPSIARIAEDAIPKAYVSLLNSQGILAVRSGTIEQGVDQYRNALIYAVDPLTKGRVAFNLGLAYLRWKKTKEAEGWLKQSLFYSKGEFLKAQNKLDEISYKLLEVNSAKTKENHHDINNKRSQSNNKSPSVKYLNELSIESIEYDEEEIETNF